MTLPKLTLVLGGAASGKSAFAENLILQSVERATYLATGQAFDAEMAEKIRLHQQARDNRWSTMEAPIELAQALGCVDQTPAILIDCATLWLTNILLAERNVEEETSSLLDALSGSQQPIVIVSNETGQGIVPDNTLSRRFRNAQGRLNQDIAAQADLVVAVMAGLPLVLKGSLP